MRWSKLTSSISVPQSPSVTTIWRKRINNSSPFHWCCSTSCSVSYFWFCRQSRSRMFIAFERLLDNNELEFERWTRRTFNYSVACSPKWLSTSSAVLFPTGYSIYSIATRYQDRTRLQETLNSVLMNMLNLLYFSYHATSIFVFIGISKAFRNELKRYVYKLIGKDLITTRTEDQHQQQQQPEPDPQKTVVEWFLDISIILMRLNVLVDWTLWWIVA